MATSTPASSGPAVMVSPKLIMFRALAAGSSSLRTRTGMMALRAGWLMACAPLCTATRAYSSHTLPSCSQACRASAAVVSQSTDGGQEGHRAAVVGVGDRAAQQAAEHQRHEGKDAQQADVEAVLGEPVHLQADGHQGQLAAEGGDGGPEPQAAEGRTFAQRRDVRQEFPHPATLVAGL